MECQEDRESIGCSRSPRATSPPKMTSLSELPTARDSSKKATPPDTGIGRFWWCCDEKDHCPRLRIFSVPLATQSSPDRQPQMTTSGRKTPELESNLSLGLSRSNAITRKIGTRFGTLPRRGISTGFPQTYESNVIGHYVPLERISLYLSLWYDDALCFVEGPELVSQDGPGKKPLYRLTLRIHEANSGTAIEIKNMLSSMNFEAVSTSPICLDGSIGTHVLWRSKDLAPCWQLESSG